ncbi:unnamed protein product [Diplocarpon coronariae]|nr:hypothetical protein JHW43_000248 [Diplocarpon mali]
MMQDTLHEDGTISLDLGMARGGEAWPSPSGSLLHEDWHGTVGARQLWEIHHRDVSRYIDLDMEV